MIALKIPSSVFSAVSSEAVFVQDIYGNACRCTDDEYSSFHIHGLLVYHWKCLSFIAFTLYRFGKFIFQLLRVENITKYFRTNY
jgi:hypothetical protein